MEGRIQIRPDFVSAVALNYFQFVTGGILPKGGRAPLISPGLIMVSVPHTVIKIWFVNWRCTIRG